MTQEQDNAPREESRRGFLERVLHQARDPENIVTSSVLTGIMAAVAPRAIKRTLDEAQVTTKRQSAQANEEQYGDVFRIHQEIYRKIGKKAPPLYVFTSDLPALANVGGRFTWVSTKALEILNEKELAALMTHEAGHSTLHNKAIEGGFLLAWIFGSIHAGVAIDSMGNSSDDKMTRRKFGYMVAGGLTAAAGIASTMVTDAPARYLQQLDADDFARRYCDPRDLASALKTLEGWYQKNHPSTSQVEELLGAAESIVDNARTSRLER